MDVVRSDAEIGRVENWACEGNNTGTRYPGMTYEQGILDLLLWLRGDETHAPDEE